MWRQSKRIHR
jgi:hypothetical protein